MARKKSEMDSTMVEAVGDVFDGDSPGATVSRNIEFEGLGNLLDFPKEMTQEDSEEGSGEWCVVEADYMTGANGIGYSRGDVRRLSKLIQGYDTMSQKTEGAVKAEVRRLVDTGAFRIAAPDEQDKGHLDLGLRFENEEVVSERNRRIKAERELAALKGQGKLSDTDGWEMDDEDEDQTGDTETA